MTTKQYLQQARKLDARIDAKLKQIDDLKDLALKTTTTLSKGKTSGGPILDSKVADAVNRIVDLENEVNADIDKLVAIKRDISWAIEQVENDDYKILLELRYLCKLTWEQIAVKSNYSYFHVVHRMHPKALDAIKDVIECYITPVI